MKTDIKLSHCIDCAKPITMPTGRGRNRVRCSDCRDVRNAHNGSEKDKPTKAKVKKVVRVKMIFCPICRQDKRESNSTYHEGQILCGECYRLDVDRFYDSRDMEAERLALHSPYGCGIAMIMEEA